MVGHIDVETFARALDRAIQEGCKVRETEAGFRVRSGSDHRRWYLTTIYSCSCRASRGGRGFCKHRALIAYITGSIDKLVAATYEPGPLTTLDEVLVA